MEEVDRSEIRLKGRTCDELRGGYLFLLSIQGCESYDPTCAGLGREIRVCIWFLAEAGISQLFFPVSIWEMVYVLLSVRILHQSDHWRCKKSLIKVVAYVV